MSKRKTIDVAELVNDINRMISRSETEQERIVLGVLAESVLMRTGNYKGFQLLPSEFLPPEEQTNEHVLRPDYDSTKRRYYLPA